MAAAQYGGGDLFVLYSGLRAMVCSNSTGATQESGSQSRNKTNTEKIPLHGGFLTFVGFRVGVSVGEKVGHSLFW